MQTHLLCPTDFSEAARRAADVAAALAARMKLPLKLLHSVPEAVVSVEMPVIPQLEERARQALEAEAMRLRAQGVEVTTDIHFGTAAEDILRGVTKEATRMIVLGSVGRGMAMRWLIGNVAERVAEHAPVPTLVVRQAEPLLSWLQGHADLKVVCGVDFSVSADAALLAVRDLGSCGPCQVHAAYVEWPDDWPWPTPGGFVDTGGQAWQKTQEAHQQDLRERAGDLLEGMPVTVHVRGTGGRLDYEFVRLADELQAGLVVVGTHQRHGFQRLKGPSFSRGTLAHASGNVLCVPLASYAPAFKAPSFRKVLVATDFSPGGNEALRHAYGVLGQGGTLHLLHVREPAPGTRTLIGGTTGPDAGEAETSAHAADKKRLMTLLPKEMTERGIAVEVHVAVDRDVAAAICETANRLRVDLVCLGSRGQSGLVAAVAGSVAQAVVARSRVPVLTAPAVER